MFAVVAFILLFTWVVGLTANLIGGYVNIFLFGSVIAYLAHYLGREDRRAWM
jgi:hypothetical protein